ncbi:hypothetical protein JA1_002514 [Spathaspora sp. JA1]|nr:hypothetical protein JA1_002514 [Spathaspora sp. JA1]
MNVNSATGSTGTSSEIKRNSHLTGVGSARDAGSVATIAYLEDKIDRLMEEIGFLKQVVDFQGSKIDKLASIVFDKNSRQQHDEVLLQGIPDVDHDQINEVQRQVEQLPQAISVGGRETNMDPALQQVAAAAAAAQAQTGGYTPEQPQEHPPLKKRKSNKKKSIREEDIKHEQAAKPGPAPIGSSSKKPKIIVDFLHNPMSVKEIYDEFTKGFKGQLPLCQMDEKYGKSEWRGDSRSKESKRFQRRKKLCDAIDRGTIKYNKSVEEIIGYIEEFRGDKSLTWVMNGNLPSDLET